MNFVVGPVHGSPDVRVRFRNVMTDQKPKAGVRGQPGQAAQPRVATVSENQLLTVSPLKPEARLHQPPKHLSSQAFAQHHQNSSQCIRPRTTASKSQAQFNQQAHEYYNHTLQGGQAQTKPESRASCAPAQRPSPAQLKGLHAAHDSFYGNFKKRRPDGQVRLPEQAPGPRCLAEKWGPDTRVAGPSNASVPMIKSLQHPARTTTS